MDLEDIRRMTESEGLTRWGRQPGASFRATRHDGRGRELRQTGDSARHFSLPTRFGEDAAHDRRSTTQGRAPPYMRHARGTLQSTAGQAAGPQHARTD